MKTVIDWYIFRTLLILSLLSVLAVFPYVITLQGEVIKQLNMPIGWVLIAQLIQSSILFAFAIFTGLILAKSVNLSLPLLEALSQKNDFKKLLKDIVFPSTLLGIFVAFAIYITDSLFTISGISITTHTTLAPIWQKLLAAFYGGITEEILMRLFFMSLLIWIGSKVTRKNPSNQVIVVLSIILSSVVFGLGHLPITAALTDLTPMVIMRAIVLNGIGGIIFGFLYWKKGLEAAMISHFFADIFLLTLLPLLLR